MDLGGRFLVLADHDKQLNARMFADPSFSPRWRLGKQDRVNLGLDGGNYWLLTTIRNTSDQPLERLVVLDYAAINASDLYRLRPDRAPEPLYQNVGTDFAYSQRPMRLRKTAVVLDFAPGEEILLLWRVDSHPLFRFHASLWEPEYFFEQDHIRVLVYGMLYGSLAVMGIYNLFLALSVRQRSYFFYVLYLLFTGYMMAAEEGHIYQFLSTEQAWPKQHLYTLSYALSVITFYLFASAFLNLRGNTQRLHHAFRGVAGLAVALILIAGFLEFSWAVRSALLIVLVVYVIALVVAVRVRLRGITTSAGHFAIAILLLLFGVVGTNLAALGLLPLSAGIESYTAVGTVLMMVFFSLALADRINELQREVADANAVILRAVREKQQLSSELVRAKHERIRLEQSASSALQESRAKSNFLGTMSHEIRTPMHGVLGMAELLRSTPLDNNQLHYVDTIERSGRSLMEIFNNLIDYAVVEAGGMELVIEDFDLERLIDDCVAIYSLRAVEKNINFIADIDDDVPLWLRGDANKLRQVLLNLLSNAFKFTPSGDVVLRISRTRRTAVNSIELRFEVQDSGPGIDEATREQLFTAFAEQQGQRPDDSSGLGLAISRELVALMDGKIDVESQPGEGALFWFTARLLEPVGEHPAVRAVPRFSGRRLLLALADARTRDITQRTLASWGFDVSVAGDARAVETLMQDIQSEGQPVTLVLLDQELDDPELSLARRLAARQPAPEVILVSGMQFSPTERELAAARIRYVVEKPITHSQLLDAFNRALDSAATPESDTTQAPDLSALKVLIAEDNSVNQLVISALLRNLGIQPVLTANGREALEAFARAEFDLVLMDCEMPELDGYQASQQIRALEARKQRPRSAIIALSAHAGSDHLVRARQAGMDEFLTKPVGQAQLLAAITHLFRKNN